MPGNKLDKETFRSIISEVRKNYIVADMGIITGDNNYYLTGGKTRNGYVSSFSVRCGSGIDGKPSSEDDDLNQKQKDCPINVTMTSGKTAKKTVYEKQVVFRAKKYADKAKGEREEVGKKALDLTADPTKPLAPVAKYVKHLEFDKQTGEILEGKQRPYFDADKLAQDEIYNGYYAIVTR